MMGKGGEKRCDGERVERGVMEWERGKGCDGKWCDGVGKGCDWKWEKGCDGKWWERGVMGNGGKGV